MRPPFGAPNFWFRRIRNSGLAFPANSSQFMEDLTGGAAIPVATSGSSQYPFFRRIVVPVDGYVIGYGIERNALLTGSGATLDLNGGFFDSKADANYSPNDLISGLEAIQQWTGAEEVGWSSRHIRDSYFSRVRWLPRGTPLWFGGLYQVSGTISTGGVNGTVMMLPQAQIRGNAAYRGSVRGTSVRAYSSATLAGLPAAIGSSFPTNWTAVNSVSSSSDNFASLNVILFMDETY